MTTPFPSPPRRRGPRDCPWLEHGATVHHSPCWGGRPPTASSVQTAGCHNHSQGKPSDDDYQGQVGYIQERLSSARRGRAGAAGAAPAVATGQIEKVFAKLPPTRVGLEACGASHHWGRVLRDLGHEVMLIPPQSSSPTLNAARTT